MLIDPTLLEEEKAELPFEFDTREQELAFREQLMGWTRQYGKIYSIEINDVVFFFKLLSKNEMDLAKEIYDDDYDRTEYICKVSVIEPQIDDYSLDIFAGVPEVLCRAILEESGYISEDKVSTMIARWEHKMGQKENQLPLIIKEAFQDIPIEEIESWSFEKTSEYYVKAKWLLENLRGLKLVSDEER